MCREINVNDRFVVIASDGVFEFLTNQMVADIVARFADPLEACKSIVNAAYNMWLQYEVRTDDITIIAIYVDEFGTKATFNATSSFYHPSQTTAPESPVPPTGLSLKAGQLEMLESRPVRRAMSREKKKHMITLKASEDDPADEIGEEEMKSLITPKQPEDEQIILSAMRSNFLFHHLNALQRNAVISVMQPVNVKAGDWIIKQGDAGDKFYIVDSGRFEVRVRSATVTGPPSTDSKEDVVLSDEDKEKMAGNVVHVYESGQDQHPGFGELSLM